MNYYVLLTDIGQAKIANAVALGQQIKLTHIAVGDANGQTPQPQSNVKALVHERYRASINRVDIDSHNANWIVLEQVLPPDTGGWEIREVGAFDADGNLIAYGNYPPTYKPMLAEGTSRTQTVRIVMQVSDTAAVTLKVDPSIVLATRQYVDEGDAKQAAALTKAMNTHETSRNHPEADAAQKGFVRLATTDEALAGTQDRAAMTPKTSKAAIDALKLGDAAQMSHSMASLDDVSGHRNEVADTSQLVELRQRLVESKEEAHHFRGYIAFSDNNWDDIVKTGIYRVDPGNNSLGKNAPPANYQWGVLIVESNNNDIVTQTYKSHLGGCCFYRMKWGGATYSAWSEYLNTSTLAAKTYYLEGFDTLYLPSDNQLHSADATAFRVPDSGWYFLSGMIGAWGGGGWNEQTFATFWAAGFMKNGKSLTAVTGGHNSASGNHHASIPVSGKFYLNKDDRITAGFYHDQGKPWESVHLNSTLTLIKIGD